MQAKSIQASLNLDKLNAWIYKPFPAYLTYGVAVAIAIWFLAYLFPWAMFNGNSIIFDYGDNGIHTSGWWFYAKDTWHFPLLHTSRIDHPEGISIAFTDSIPLAALFFKALMTLFPSFFPEHFHYFGWWIGFVFITQAISATFLIRVLGVKSIFATFITVVFVLTWPVLHVRYSHAALMLHSILLFGLAMYFYGIQHPTRSSYVSFAFIALHIVALLVHPYFLPFTFGLFVAFLAESALKNGNWVKSFLRILFLLTLLLATAMVMGYLGRSTTRSGYYGVFYYFNLASPFCGDSRYLQCGYGPDITRFEGYNYFGLGLIGLLTVSIALFWRDIVSFPKRHMVLFLVLLGLFFYAVSNHIWLGPYKLFSFELPSWLVWLTGTFRAAGRFFWLIGYLILILTIVAFCKPKKWYLGLLLAAALVIQVKDVKPYLTQIKTLAAKPRALNYDEWTPIMAQIDKISVYPAFECGLGDLQYYTWIMQLAGFHGKLLNSGITARDIKDCKTSAQEFLQPLQPRHLYVISSESYADTPFKNKFTFPKSFETAAERGECVKRFDSMMCLPGVDPKIWQSTTLNTSPAKLLKNGRIWYAAGLHSNTGKVAWQGEDQFLTPKNTEKADWLSYGPYIRLPQAKYRFAVQYISAAAKTKHVGNLDIVLQSEAVPSEKRLFDAKLQGTEGEKALVEGFFTIGQGEEVKPLEIRSYFLAQGDLKMVSVTIEQVP